MASYSTESKSFHEVRSLSLPSKLNHINQRLEQELKKLGSKEEASTSASQSIIIGVSGLAGLYGCINQALSLPMTQQALSLRQHEKHVGELLHGCCSLLRVCTEIKEVVSKQKAITKEMESCLSSERNFESSKFGSSIAVYNSSRKEVIRNAKDVIMFLNQINARVSGKEENHLSTVIKSLRCVSIINLSVYESLLRFLSLPVCKSKRSFFSKLVNKGRGNCAGGNEIGDVDVVLHELNLEIKVGKDENKLCVSSLEILKALVNVVDNIENGLESMHKELSATKDCLMNIVSF